MMYDENDVVLLDDTFSQKAPDPVPQEANHLLRVQFFVCLFLAAVLYFAWKQGGPLWKEMSDCLEKILEQGLSFSGQEELTRFTDDVYDFWGRLVQTFAVQQ